MNTNDETPIDRNDPLALLRGCYDMLQEITAHIRRIESDEYKRHEELKDFSINVAADIYSEMIEESVKENIKNNFKNKKS